MPVSVAALSIKTGRNRTLLNITPNAFPATRYNARRDLGDESVVEYVQVSRAIAIAEPVLKKGKGPRSRRISDAA